MEILDFLIYYMFPSFILFIGIYSLYSIIHGYNQFNLRNGSILLIITYTMLKC